MSIDLSVLNNLKVNKILLMYKYKLAEYNETSLLSINYVQKFTEEALPDNFNPFEDEVDDKDDDDDNYNKLLKEEEEQLNMNSRSLRKVYNLISYKTHPDRCDDEELNKMFVEASIAYEKKDLANLTMILEKIIINRPVYDQSDVNLISHNIKVIIAKTNRIKSQVAWKWHEAETDEEKDAIHKWVNDLVIKKIVKKKKYKSENEDIILKCSICLDNIDNEHDIGILRCTHKFHYECIISWLNISLVCPFCKKI